MGGAGVPRTGGRGHRPPLEPVIPYGHTAWPHTYDVDRLLATLETVDNWCKPSKFADTGSHEGYRRARIRGSGKPPLRIGWEWVTDDFEPVWAAVLTMLEPGGYIIPHHDAGPYRERWHIPIVSAGTFTMYGEEFTPVAGVPFRVEHWLTHSVKNDTDTRRIHLLLDRGPELDIPEQQFEVVTDG